MKRLITIAFALLFCFDIQAQTTDTVVNNFTAAPVTPVRFSISDTADVAYIGAFLDYDDLRSYANVKAILMDSSGNVLYQTYVRIEGGNYQAWPGSNNSVFEFLADKLGLTLLR